MLQPYETKQAPAAFTEDDEETGVKQAIGKFATGLETFKKNHEESVKSLGKRVDQIETAVRRNDRAFGDDGKEKRLSEESKAFIGFIKNGETKAMSVGSDPDGGYLAPDDMTSRIVAKIYDMSPFRQIAGQMTTTKEAVEMLLDNDEADAEWVSETQSRSTTGTPQIGMLRIPTHELHAQPKATQKLLDDADINVEAWLTGKVADKFQRTEDAAFVSGTGVGQPRGFLNYTAVTTADATRTWGQLQYVATGNGSSFNADDVVTADQLHDLIAALKTGYRPGAVFLMNRATANVIRKLKDAQDRYIWSQGLQAGQPSTLLGYPVSECEDMPNAGSGTFPIAFGNFREGYTIVDRQGIRMLRDPYTAKPHVLFDTTKRVGGDVVNFDAIKLLKCSAS